MRQYRVRLFMHNGRTVDHTTHAEDPQVAIVQGTLCEYRVLLHANPTTSVESLYQHLILNICHVEVDED